MQSENFSQHHFGVNIIKPKNVDNALAHTTFLTATINFKTTLEEGGLLVLPALLSAETPKNITLQSSQLESSNSSNPALLGSENRENDVKKFPQNMQISEIIKNFKHEKTNHQIKRKRTESRKEVGKKLCSSKETLLGQGGTLIPEAMLNPLFSTVAN